MIDGSDFCKVCIVSVDPMLSGVAQEPYKYAYLYTISIENISSLYTLQILSRKWIIRDGDMKDRTVVGNKVVGEVPILKPNETFVYQSYHLMVSSFGCALGFYYGVYTSESDPEKSSNAENQPILSQGDAFSIKIPLFKLITLPN